MCLSQICSAVNAKYKKTEQTVIQKKVMHETDPDTVSVSLLNVQQGKGFR